MTDNHPTDYTYYAFISYKREDEKWAKWLQKRLESYGFPVALRKDHPSLPKKIYPVFRDQSELSGGNLKEEIEKGLSNSHYLIVICSPRSAQSPWVSKEVQYFIDNGKEDKIIPFIIGGTPNSKTPEDECFPEGLRQLSGEREILGININEMGRDAALIKVIARMFGLRFDTLWQRHERAKRRRRFAVIAGVAVFALVSLFVAGVMLDLKTQADTQAQIAKNESKRANEQTLIAEKERDNVLKANKSLEIANDSIKRQSTLIARANQDLAESNRRLAEERDNVLKANWKMMENHARSVAAKAMTEIEKGNVMESIMALLTVVPNANEKPYLPEVERALRLGYEKYNSPGWIYTELDGYYDFMYLTPDEKYLICENVRSIDILNTENNIKIAQIDRKHYENEDSDKYGVWGALSSKDSSKLYVIDDKEVRIFDIATLKFIPGKNDINEYRHDIHFPTGYSRFMNLFKFEGDDEIISISPDFGRYLSRQIIDNGNSERESEHYILKSMNGNAMLTWNKDVNNDNFNLSNYNILAHSSFSPDGNLLILSFFDGHNELRYLDGSGIRKSWKCENDCAHYSNSNVFGNNNTIIHTSVFEDNIKLYDVNSLSLVDTIYFVGSNYIESSYACINKDCTKLWVNELYMPILYQRINPKVINTNGLKPLQLDLQKEIRLKDNMILLKNEKIECVNSRNEIQWIYESSLGSILLGTFDNDRIIIVMDYKPRGGNEIVFIDALSGKEVYRNGFSDFLINNDNTRIVQPGSDIYEPAYEILDYNNLIKACKDIVGNKTITRKGYNLFNLLD